MARVRIAVALSALVTVCAGARAQAVKFESPENGYRIWVPRSLEAVPNPPNERQVLAKWANKVEFKGKLRAEVMCTVMVVRIAKSKGATTGDQPEDGTDGKKTIREEIQSQLNAGTTLETFLQHRGYQHELQPIKDWKPLKLKSGAEYTARQVIEGATDTHGRRKVDTAVAGTVTLTVEDPQEIFGIVALGPWVEPWSDMVLAMAKSLERTAVGAPDPKKEGKYDATTKQAEFRKEVRSKVVKGWTAIDTENYILVTNAHNKGLVQKITTDIEAMRQAYIVRFPPVGDLEAVSTVRICDSLDDYTKYGGPPGTGGYWNFADEELVLFDTDSFPKELLKRNPNLANVTTLGVMYHEAMHQYFYYANGNLAPASWFNEGYGEYFGGAVLDRNKGQIERIGRNKFRMDWVKKCQKEQRFPDLNAFLLMTQREFYGASALQNYAFAWAFCYFLEEQRKDPKGNKEWGAIPDAYLGHLRDATKEERDQHHFDPKDKKWLALYEDKIQQTAYQRTFKGMDLIKLEKAWVDAMEKW